MDETSSFLARAAMITATSATSQPRKPRSQTT
jgi:hypothetical protein